MIGSEGRAVSQRVLGCQTGQRRQERGTGDDFCQQDPRGMVWEGVPPAEGPAHLSRGQPAAFPPHLLCCAARRAAASLITLPSVGGCPLSSPRSSPGPTCPSGCPPSPQSCPSGQAPPVPRRSPWAAAAPGGPLPGRCAEAAGCQAGCHEQAAPLSPPTAGARARLGPWCARTSWAPSGPRRPCCLLPSLGGGGGSLRRGGLEASGLQCLQAPQPVPRSRRWSVSRRNLQSTRGQRLGARTQLHLDGGSQPQQWAWAPQGAGRGGHGRLAPAAVLVFLVKSAVLEGAGALGSCAALAAQATIIQLLAPSS